jgi:hypothetical protein
VRSLGPDLGTTAPISDRLVSKRKKCGIKAGPGGGRPRDCGPEHERCMERAVHGSVVNGESGNYAEVAHFVSTTLTHCGSTGLLTLAGEHDI